jgi:hypothetical protein
MMQHNNSIEQTPVAAAKSNDGTVRRCSSQSRYPATEIIIDFFLTENHCS